MAIQVYPTIGRSMIISGLALVLFSCIVGVAWAQQQAAKKERIQELQEERLKVAQELVRVRSVRLEVDGQSGQLSAARILLEAELELCLTREDRI